MITVVINNCCAHKTQPSDKIKYDSTFIPIESLQNGLILKTGKTVCYIQAAINNKNITTYSIMIILFHNNCYYFYNFV